MTKSGIQRFNVQGIEREKKIFFHSEKEISEQETNQKKKWWKIMPLAEAGCNDCCYLIFYLSLLF